MVHPERRQHQQQVHRGQQRIERRDAHLRKHHAAKGVAQAVYALAQGLRQGRQCLVRACLTQCNEAADDQTDNEMQQDASGIPAELSDFQRMRAQPFDQFGANDRAITLWQPRRRP
jgi:hypothetical protein